MRKSTQAGLVHTNPDILETGTFFSPRFVWTGPFTLGKEALSVSGLTGFVWTENRFMWTGPQ